MLLPKTIDLLTEAAAKTDENVYALTSIKVDKERMYASNGHSLYYADTKSTYSEEDYPDTIDIDTEPTLPILLPRKALIKAIANRPKKGSMQILQENIRLLGDDRKLRLVTTDLDTSDDVVIKNEQKEYPRVESIISVADKYTDHRTVTISRAELEQLCRVLKKSGETMVHISVGEKGDMVLAVPENKSFSAIIMPCTI